MTNNITKLSTVLIIIAAVLVFSLIVLILLYYKFKNDSNKPEKQKDKALEENKKEHKKNEKIKQYTVASVFDFMEFDKIEDNMIIQKNGKKFLMAIECQGINYDLMSAEEKNAVEEGFIQFLNTLNNPIQLYVQTRKVNLEGSLRNYEEKVEQIEMNYKKQTIKYNQMRQTPGIQKERLSREYYELVKLKNLYEYGKDIVLNTEKMSLNKDILTKKYYIIISYMPEEDMNLDKEEIRESAFSELYARARTIISALTSSDVIGRILDSTELAELLYVTYNREDADLLGVDKAIKAKYNELYVTAPDYMEEKVALLDKEIEKKAYERANGAIIQAQSKLQEEYEKKNNNKNNIINDIAKMIIAQNQDSLGQEVTNAATEIIEKTDKNKEEEQ